MMMAKQKIFIHKNLHERELYNLNYINIFDYSQPDFCILVCIFSLLMWLFRVHGWSHVTDRMITNNSNSFHAI